MTKNILLSKDDWRHCSAVSVHCTLSGYWCIWWTVLEWTSISLQKKKSFSSLCFFLFIQNGRGASSFRLHSEGIHHIHCLRWRMVMLSCIAPLLPLQTICFRESWGQIFCCTSFPFMVPGLLHPSPYSVCPIPRFTHTMKTQQSCICHVSLLPVGPLKSAGFPLV